MDPRALQLLEAWRLAEVQARQAEIALFHAHLQHARGRGPEPPEAQAQQARALRSTASRAYEEAMAAVDHVLLHAASGARRGPSARNG